MNRALATCIAATAVGCGGVYEARDVAFVGSLDGGAAVEAALSPPFEVRYQNNSLCFVTMEPTPADPNRIDKVLSRGKGHYFAPRAFVSGIDGRQVELVQSSSGNAPKFCFLAAKESLPLTIAKVTLTSPEPFHFSAAVLSTQSVP